VHDKRTIKIRFLQQKTSTKHSKSLPTQRNVSPARHDDIADTARRIAGITGVLRRNLLMKKTPHGRCKDFTYGRLGSLGNVDCIGASSPASVPEDAGRRIYKTFDRDNMGLGLRRRGADCGCRRFKKL
jgi:hypothetical protein